MAKGGKKKIISDVFRAHPSIPGNIERQAVEKEVTKKKNISDSAKKAMKRKYRGRSLLTTGGELGTRSKLG